MSNEEDGYTPVVTTDSQCGFIVDSDVPAEVKKTAATATAMDRIEETFGQTPEKSRTEAGNNCGHVMQQLEDRDVEFYAPVESNQPQEGSTVLLRSGF